LQELQTHITRIQTKLQHLVKKHVQLQKHSLQQQEIISKLTEEKELNQKKIKILEEQQLILKSAAGELSTTDKKAFEQAIGKYIREIDKCIALLSE
jgi:predicted transcriptional regulator